MVINKIEQHHERQTYQLSDQETRLLNQLRLQMDKNQKLQEESQKLQQESQQQKQRLELKIARQDKIIQQQKKNAQKDKKMPPVKPFQQNKEPSKQSKMAELKLVEVQGKIVELHPSVNVVHFLPPKNATLGGNLCVPLPGSSRPVTICIHDPLKDITVSAAIKNKQLWKRDIVLHMDHELQMNPEMGLVDLGANIGVYTLMAASRGRNVLAVDILDSNIMLLQRSLHISNMSSQVTLVKNAIYKNNSVQLGYASIKNNIGRAIIDETEALPNKIQSACLDDLVPLVQSKVVYLKMALENSEHLALVCGHEFFNKVNIQVVQMEWVRKSEEATGNIKYFMRQHNYTAKILDGTGYKSWEDKFSEFTGEVFFLKGSV